MSAPKWLNDILQEFGRGLELRSFGLNASNAASLRLETGSSLRFEYAYESLVIAMLVPAPRTPELMKHLLVYAQPERRPAFKMRVAYLEKSASALFAARLSEREVDLSTINAVFTELWRSAEEFRLRMGVG